MLALLLGETINMNEKKRKLFVLILILHTVCTYSAFAETYKFVGTTFPFILEKDSSGKIIGIGAEIAREVITKIGHDIEIGIYPWKRAQAMVKEGDAHVLIGPYKTQEREKFLDYNKYHFFQDNMVFYAKSGLKQSWDGKFYSLQNKTIAIMAGWSYGPKADANLKKLKTHDFYSVLKGLELVSLERYDFCALNQRNALAIIQKHNLQNQFDIIDPPISKTKGYFGFSKKLKLDKLIIQFDKELKTLIDSDKVSLLNKKYGLFYSCE